MTLMAVAILTANRHACATIVHSGTVNITIPNTIDGVYLNMVTGQTSTAPLGMPGWDFNPYFGGNQLFFPSNLQIAVMGAGNEAANIPVYLEGAGVPIGPSSNWITGPSITTSAFVPGVSGAIGIRFTRETDNMTLYGWVRFTTSAFPGNVGQIVEYAYEDSGEAFPMVPAPGAVAPLLGLLMMRSRRSRLRL